MNDNDVDDLARVVAGHFSERDYDQGCAMRCGYDGDDRANHLARAVLASGAVVPARDVEALDALAHSKNVRVYGDYGAGWRDGVMTALRSLLREPATDAAPTGALASLRDDPDDQATEYGLRR